MTLGNHSRDEVGSDDAPLRVGRKEDGVGPAEVVDPCGIGEVCFVQPTSSAEYSIARPQPGYPNLFTHTRQHIRSIGAIQSHAQETDRKLTCPPDVQ